MARFQIDDGYSLDGVTSPEAKDRQGNVLPIELPVISYRYRPALPDAMAEWRIASAKAMTGHAEVEASAALLAGHLVKWDVTDIMDVPMPVEIATIRKIPEPLLNQLISAVTTWAPRAKAAAGNSPGV